MLQRFSLLIILLFSFVLVQAQSEWEKNRKPYDLAVDEQEYPLYYMYRAVHYDYKYDDKGSFVCDITYHEIAKVNNEEALQSKNKIYIPMTNVIDVLDIQSRTISASGKTTSLDQNDVKEVKDETKDSGYRIFAVEGAEIGSEIEYRYVKRVNGSVFENLNIQFPYPVKQFDFGLRCPENMEFEFQTINDSLSVQQVDTSETVNEYELSMESIPEFVSEEFSGGEAMEKRIDFKLAYNSNAGRKRLNTYPDAGKRIYESAIDYSKSETKLLKKLLDENNPSNLSAIDRFRLLEHVVKNKYYADKNAPADLEFLLTNGTAHERAFLKLFVGIAKQLGVDYEIVVTSDRTQTRFNEDFDSWSYLNDFLMYLPKTKQYMSPSAVNCRLGLIPGELTATYALFIKPTKIQDFVYPVTRVDYIPEQNYLTDQNNLDIKVQISDDFSSTKVQVDQAFVGNQAGFLKSAISWMDQERKDQMLDEMVRYISQEAKIEKVEVSELNDNYDAWMEPFVISAAFDTEGFIERAGPNFILKVGELIGPQSQLYQEKERKFPVENVSNRSYFREIVVDLPKGYSIQNLESINMNDVVREGDRVIYQFVSSYEIKDNQLYIEISEYYNQIYFPLNRFEEFRKVINAAADWNKVSLIFKRSS
ncbi:DUF3857 domain-containing protein [Reichenbachiella ulvae]|uniref:DUF3857 domain-containing protein n=1 Tax=Reichenbachiella ulvae TaxID=2980104 RepID=A0ABT3CRL1_9BACT|nr:DUF3857 domain-containing protein [Reichenbachiella ulvae]MCV9386346.1 DUF3857 domain-containing protein [Reichenbachiella ulvae]